MKKVKLIVFLTIVGVILFYFILNQIDTELNPGSYTLKDLPEASFEADNGFYILWGLGEPDTIDVTSESYCASVKELIDNSLKTGKRRSFFDHEKYRMNFNRYDKFINPIAFPSSFEDDWLTAMSRQTDLIEKAQKNCPILMVRYQKLIAAPQCRDFIPPSLFAPQPNLLAFLKTAKFHTAICSLKALEGKWDEATTDLLNHIDFLKRVHANGHTLMLTLLTSTIMESSLQSLISIMNHPQCPPSVYTLVSEKLKPLNYNEYGNRIGFIAECLSTYSLIDQVYDGNGMGDFSEFPTFGILPSKLFMQKNRTKNYFYNYYSLLIEYDEMEPHKWPFKSPKEIQERFNVKKSFWWLQNPVGKILCTISIPYTDTVIYKTCKQRSYYDLTRIAAEFHLKYIPGSDVQETLNTLNSYKTVDPYSGKPYVWNNNKKILYGMGADRKDNNGTTNERQRDKSDFGVPLAIKNIEVKKIDKKK